MANSFPVVSSNRTQRAHGVVISLDVARQWRGLSPLPRAPAAATFQAAPTGLRAIKRLAIDGAVYLLALIVGLIPVA